MLEAVGVRTLRSQGYVFNIELTYRALRAGFRVAEVPITFRDRTVGESKISLGIAVEALWLVPVLRFPVARSAVACEHLDPRRPAGGRCARRAADGPARDQYGQSP